MGLLLVLLFSAFLRAAAPASGETPAPAETRDAISEVRALRAGHRLTEAEAAARRLLASLETSIGRDAPEAVEVSGLLVHILMELGKKRLPEAVEVAERALASAERIWGPAGRELDQPLRDLGDVLAYFGSHVEAQEIFQRQVENCLAVPELGGRCAGSAYSALGTNSRNLGDLAAARLFMEQAVPLLEKDTSIVGRRELGGHLYALSALCMDEGDLDAALHSIQRSISILEALPPPENGFLCMSISQLSGVRRELGQYELARDLLTPCIRKQMAAAGENDGTALTWLSSQARSISRLGDYETARKQAERALAQFARNVPENDHTLGFFKRNLALVHIDAGHDAAAEPLLEDTVRVKEMAFGSRHPALAQYLELLARVEFRLGKDPEALEHALRAESIARSRFQDVAAVVSEREAYRFEASRASGLQVSFSVLSRAADPKPSVLAGVWDEMVRSRALVFDELTSRNRAASRGEDPRVASLLLDLRKAGSRLAALAIHAAAAPSAESSRLIAEAQARKEDLERELSRRGVAIGLREEQTRAGLEAVRSALPAGGALLAYVEFDRLSGPVSEVPDTRPRSFSARASTTEPWYAALVMTRASPAPRYFSLGPGHEIQSLVQRWREQAGAPPSGLKPSRMWEDRYRQAGLLLRQRVWDPVVPALAGAEVVFVVPDGALHLVSLATLPSDDGRYLVESDPMVHYLSTERDLVRDAASSRVTRGALLLGAPDLEAAPAATGRPGFRSTPAVCSDMQSLRFDPLPSTMREIDDVRALLEPGETVTTLTGPAATEAAFKTLAPGKRLLHVATHGFFVQDRCPSPLPQERLRGTSVGLSLAGTRVASDNPLLLSGLTLAGANLRTQETAIGAEDGLLTAEEVGALDLSGVEWAVLSACETGVGKVLPGEGVLGLRRAFSVAGAGTLIMSLWRVEDEPTRVWMRNLYRARREGLSTLRCVTEASRAVLRGRREKDQATHPFYWGGFVAEGDWRQPRGGRGAGSLSPRP